MQWQVSIFLRHHRRLRLGLKQRLHPPTLVAPLMLSSNMRGRYPCSEAPSQPRAWLKQRLPSPRPCRPLMLSRKQDAKWQPSIVSWAHRRLGLGVKSNTPAPLPRPCRPLDAEQQDAVAAILRHHRRSGLASATPATPTPLSPHETVQQDAVAAILWCLRSSPPRAWRQAAPAPLTPLSPRKMYSKMQWQPSIFLRHHRRLGLGVKQRRHSHALVAP